MAPSAKPITDVPAIRAIITDPWIAERIRHDYWTPDYIEHPDVVYLGCYVGEELAGVMMLIYDHIEVSIHAYIRRSWMRFGRWFVAQSVAYAFASPNVAKVAAQVREGLESAVNCGLKLGFVREGFLRDAVQRDGRLYGVHLLAITRRDYGRIQENR